MCLEMLGEVLLEILGQWLLKSKAVRWVLLVLLPVGCLALTYMMVTVMIREKSWIMTLVGINLIAGAVIGTVFGCRALYRRNKMESEKENGSP